MIIGGLLFGLVFMATDPVSSPSMHSAKWIYGFFCGMVAIIIRGINPAYPRVSCWLSLWGMYLHRCSTTMRHVSIETGGHAMSSPQPENGAENRENNARTIIFMTVLSLVCAIILSVLASALSGPKEIAKDLDRSKQMLIAAKILDYDGYFLLQDEKGNYIPGKYDKDGIIIPGSERDIATNSQILDVYQKRLVPMLTDDTGNSTSFQKAASS